MINNYNNDIYVPKVSCKSFHHFSLFMSHYLIVRLNEKQILIECKYSRVLMRTLIDQLYMQMQRYALLDVCNTTVHPLLSS